MTGKKSKEDEEIFSSRATIAGCSVAVDAGTSAGCV